ncbi:MAG: SDR family NAD(P)-dependent oxidoreductase [Bacteroidales bacterium]|jgi:NAD(P)-dependent dehydrogenase (short-subunit alcohol dehydrogenase family)
MKGNKFTRRDVIKTSGLSLAAMAVPSALTSTGSRQKRSPKKGRVAFITGGARGIGLKTAETFAKDGADIVLFDIADQIPGIRYPLSTPADLDKAKKKIEALGSKCLAIRGDVRNMSDLNKAVQRTVDEFGRLDFLVANAAVTQVGPAESYDDAIIRDLLAINVGGVLKTIQAAIPVFRNQRSGRIVAMSSVAGRGGAFMFSLYSASKWGVIGLAKTIAQELGGLNVTCNVVCPTLVRTPMLENDHILKGINPGNPTIEGAAGFIKGMHTLPVGVLDPKEIADAINFLCSDETTHVSGMVLDVSAGYTAGNTA